MNETYGARHNTFAGSFEVLYRRMKLWDQAGGVLRRVVAEYPPRFDRVFGFRTAQEKEKRIEKRLRLERSREHTENDKIRYESALRIWQVNTAFGEDHINRAHALVRHTLRTDPFYAAIGSALGKRTLDDLFFEQKRFLTPDQLDVAVFRTFAPDSLHERERYRKGAHFAAQYRDEGAFMYFNTLESVKRSFADRGLESAFDAIQMTPFEHEPDVDELVRLGEAFAARKGIRPFIHKMSDSDAVFENRDGLAKEFCLFFERVLLEETYQDKGITNPPIITAKTHTLAPYLLLTYLIHHLGPRLRIAGVRTPLSSEETMKERRSAERLEKKARAFYRDVYSG